MKIASAGSLQKKSPRWQRNETVAILQSGGKRSMRRFKLFSSRGIEYAGATLILLNGVFLKLDESRGKA
ncbi:hypothetical protein [Paraburkholderia bannensis]|uniref:hypothetical protein n=1 Tax=Paraburkholderia bannensis TaxID=765414 RepID=UPI002AB672CC|nr:hypothetical protein [Paraburkholderia bannensis]